MTGEMCPWGKGVGLGQREPGRGEVGPVQFSPGPVRSVKRDNAEDQ
ncbi:hypothetical protein ACFOY8_05680 [Thalassospira xianhensis]|nr:hypothetical protein [Thalassospira xianhensis]